MHLVSGRCSNRVIVGRDLPGALSDCNWALALDPTNAYAHSDRGFAYLKMKNYDSAIADCDTALKVHPENASSLYGRGLAKRAKGDAAGAAQRFDPTIARQFAG